MAFLTIVVCLLAVTRGAPAQAEDSHPLLHKRTDYCHSITFEQGSDVAAPVNDCWQVYNNIVGSGSWGIGACTNRKLSSGTCSLTLTNDNQINIVYVGNDDAREIIKTAIEKYKTKGNEVSAKGDMWCKSSLVQNDRYVTWALRWIALALPPRDDANTTIPLSPNATDLHDSTWDLAPAACWRKRNV
ncbi:putative necrosis-inducing factor-domain-containing protein [Cercophora newfieldiana]|uniref:Necrosis-inducing factor-domain-containing protein n=1 Tax=Cercophora newfieldiana TaxID=92897 RepID=A0AA39Y8V8_9PEZI|nr:putative necrosis-inducing factor-domain-containing protein [Cercophora newfieldiana]